MKYTKEELVAALQRLMPNSQDALTEWSVPIACTNAAVDLFVRMDELSDTDVQLAKDITLLRTALKDLGRNGFFNYK